MSRIGKKPIPVPQGVKVAIEGLTVKAEGPKGKLSQTVPGTLSVSVEQNVLTVGRTSEHRTVRALHGLMRVSTPGRRVYVTHDKIPTILAGMGVAFVSTSRGVVTGRDARKQKVGGEVLAYVW